jgi:hypothetical protein
VLLTLAGGGYGWGFSPVMTAAVARVPLERARDASGIITTAIQVSYAVGLTALGSLFLGRAAAHVPHGGGHAFMTVAFVLAGLALVGAWLASLAAGRPRRFALTRLIPVPISGRGSADR